MVLESISSTVEKKHLGCNTTNNNGFDIMKNNNGFEFQEFQGLERPTLSPSWTSGLF